ncbi:DUF6879 family protein [Streptomyces microflavus]|uniref:DUF6879 domain-containing protein n=1 Tax=Streptomyces microflavus TaxID=1919 RepID=A0A7J0CTN0_STRMI|nr:MULTISPECIES: DUF6879 family protein [Streptomyces]MCX4653349.1 hypothetical protein [Streptomyces microflavus]MDX2979852.1 hypothetical protein [Streptomyces sp. NRRL_B-2249]WSS35703.1 hypothetical protein OG269_20585 [Streptomyces microflavus]WST15731.1 hypothetical protein OG721_17960 [Streptomyces microflavus]SCK43250.1 hypothetical protein YUYDRAFT_05403 [Streptomyces sp. ScaeMP-e48]
MLLAGEEWAARFERFQREAWRLETLPQYLMPQEAEEFEAFKGGARIDPVTVSNEYTDRLRRQVAQGRSQGRVHVLTRPLSDYLRFELHHYYRAHSSAGEEIRILDVTDRPNLLEGAQDFWLFDRSEVVLMNYHSDGRQISREVFDGDVGPFLEYRRIAVEESVAFEEYVKDLDL